MVLRICCCTLTQPLTPYLLSFFLHSPSTPQHPFLPHLTPCSHTLSVCLCFLWSTQFDLSLGRSAQNLMDFLQSNLTSSLFIAVLYPVDLIFTRPHRLLHPHTKKISSSEFKMYCWLIKGVLIECSELGNPFTKCAHTHTHTRVHTHKHTQSQWQHRVHQGRCAWGVSCQSKMERKESAHPPSEMGFLDHIMDYCSLVQLCAAMLSNPSLSISVWPLESVTMHR